MTHTKKALTTAILLTVLAVTACTQPAPKPGPVSSSQTGSGTASPSATPTPGAEVSKPATPEEAKAAAWDVVQAYWALDDQIMKEKGANPDRIKALAVNAAYADTKVHAEAVAKAQFTATGNRKVTMISAYTSDLKGQIEVLNGNVGMKVCNDVNDIHWYKPDGTPDRRPDILRTTLDVSVIYDVNQGAWRVDSVTDPKEVKPC
ncbi:hypothetical protein ABH924_003323 [Arthrobacter sp. GAS37]|uniref:hypothetical protein n=1 Tax=Arthrobacter sp. GAS37 TaxID=3156261 RepID=UPI0038389730